ncbi:hypothetical protein JKG47_10030 [Acidithiobacillus sp. MC6.1]|nr:hypothetical protein [Acidithiobacillus sp. MC6.1]
MKSQLRQDDLPSMIRALAGQKNIQIQFNGGCSIAVKLDKNGKRIMSLPPLPLKATKKEVTQIIGDADHETAHALYTDFEVIKLQGMHGTILNVIEDARIEAKLGIEYPGAKGNLADSAEIFISAPKGQAKIASLIEVKNPADIIPFWMDANFRDLQGQGKAIATAASMLRDCLNGLGFSSLCDAILGIVSDVDALTSTSDALTMTDKVMELIKEQSMPSPSKQKKARSQPEQGEGEEEEPKPEQGEGEEESESKPEQGEGEEESKPEQGEGEEEPQPEQGEGEEESQPATPAIDTSVSSKAISELIAEAVQEISDKADLKYEDPLADWGDEVPVPNAQQLAEAKALALPIVATLVAKMQAAYEATRQVRWQASDEGRINPRRLALAGAGLDPAPFRVRKAATTRINTCVSCWLDLSGSMYGANRIKPSVAAIQALAEACQRMNVPMSAHGWFQNTMLDENCDVVLSATFNAPELKGWNQPVGSGRLQEVFSCPEGFIRFTPTMQAVLASMRHVERRPEEKKIILFLTDGEPYSPSVGASTENHSQNLAATRRDAQRASAAARLAVEKGYTFVAIGMQCEIVWWQGGKNVKDLADLPAVLLGAIKGVNSRP